MIGSCTVDVGTMVCRSWSLPSAWDMYVVQYKTKIMYSICHLLVARRPETHTAVDRSKYINFQGYFVSDKLNMQVN